MILMSAMTSILFLGGWLPPFDFAPFTWIPGPFWLFAKIALVLFVFLWVRATFPRYRYDQLMRLGWKVFLPFSLFWVELGRASCRERVCQYVSISVVAVSLKKKNQNPNNRT